MSDAGVFDEIIESNALYAARFQSSDIPSRPKKALAVLTCMDARIDPLRILGLAAGDAVVLRNPGARVTDEVEGGLVVASHLLGVTSIIVMPHTDCRMAVPDAAVIREAIVAAGGPDVSDVDLVVAPDQREALRADVARLKKSPYLGERAVEGLIYDVATGRVTRP